MKEDKLKQTNKVENENNLFNTLKKFNDNVDNLIIEIKDLKENNNKEDVILMTPKEVRIMLSVSTQTVTDWARKGILKRYKLGNRAYYKRHEIINNLK